MKRKVLVVDLDGTLLDCNTFHKWLFYVLRFSLKRFKFKVFMIVSCFIVLRALKIINHATLKYFVMKETNSFNPSVYVEFCESLMEFENDLKEILYSKEFDYKILATAAPCFYAEVIAEKFSFDFCLATDYSLKDSLDNWVENIRTNKLNRVLSHLSIMKIDAEITTITDHKDDIPLMSISVRNVLVNPSSATLVAMEEQGLVFEIVNNL